MSNPKVAIFSGYYEMHGKVKFYSPTAIAKLYNVDINHENTLVAPQHCKNWRPPADYIQLKPRKDGNYEL